jgi:DNA-binding NarL/FixJ family response regulator
VIRVLLADDQALIRAGFRVLLEAAADVEVVGEAVNGEQAVDLARSEGPDVILMDIRMPGVDGLEATRRIAADGALAGVKVVILTTFETDDYVYQALRAGASGFLLKDAEPEDLIRAVRVAARGDALLSPSVTRRLIETFASRGPTTALNTGRGTGLGAGPRNGAAGRNGESPSGAGRDLSRITEREREVLSLVAEGLSNEEIATRLYLSPLTTKTHVSHIMTKLNARDRAQLVVIAYESGLVVPGTGQVLLQHQEGKAAEPRDDAVEPERVQRLVLAEVLRQEPEGHVGADPGDHRADNDRPVHPRAGRTGQVARLQCARRQDHRRGEQEGEPHRVLPAEPAPHAGHRDDAVTADAGE